MNKCWYSYGNASKVKFRKHSCYRCGEKLIIVKHRKVISQKSEEAKYYDFSIGVDGGAMVGPCEFIHKVFYCPKCSRNIEFITQINLEDIDVIIKKVIRYFKIRNREIFISKSYETKLEEVKENNFNLNDDTVLCLHILENNKETRLFNIPIIRRKFWERPHYFDITKKKLINFIK